MRGSTSLLVSSLSFVSLVTSGPLRPTHSSRFANNHISSRQFHYPRALVDVCADVDLSSILGGVLGLNHRSLLGDICLCLSAFPLDLTLDANLQPLVNLVGETGLETLLKTRVKDQGVQCTYPDHASPQCTSGNVCDFTCTDSFVKRGGTCVCPRPYSVCNGKCGPYSNGCSSALPRAPKMTRRSVTSSRSGGSHGSQSGGLDLGGLLNGLLGSPGTTSNGNQSGSSEVSIDVLVNEVLNSLGINGPVSSGNLSSSSEAVLRICIGADISGTQSLLDAITDVANSLLSSLLGTTLRSKVESLCSASANPDTVSIDLQVCGLFGGSLESTLNKTLKAAAGLLNNLLDGVNIVTNCSVGGPGCPAVSILSNSNQSPSSPSTEAPPSSSTGIHLDGGLLSGLLGQVEGVLSDLGLSLGSYDLDTDVDLIVGVSVGLSDTLGGTSGLTATVIALIDEILDSLLATDLTVQTGLDPTSSSSLSNLDQGDIIVVDIDLGAVLDATLSDTGSLVDGVLSAVSGGLATLLDLDIAVNVDGGHDCGCSGSKKASAKQ